MTLDWTQSENKSRKESESTQGSEAWLKWRGKGIGGSDSAALLGWSPYKTYKELWDEKMGRFIPQFSMFQKSAMERGKTLEPFIRKWYEQQVGAEFKEDIEECKEYPFMRASYDGVNRFFKNEDKTLGRILEIKAPNAKDHEMARSGEIPPKYLTQLNWMGIVSGINWFDYVSFGSDKTYVRVTLKADPLIQAELLRRAILFWSLVQEKKEPDEKDFKQWSYPLKKPLDLASTPEIDEQETEALVAEALKLQAELNSVEARFEILKDKLKLKLGNQDEMKCGEAVFGWQTRKGAVDYGAIEVLKTVNLEEFRKKEVKAFYFKRAK